MPSASRLRPAVNPLEDRAVPAHLLVTSPVDSFNPAGEPGSLRAALNAAADGDVIAFAPALFGQTIQLAGYDLPITHNVTIKAPKAAHVTIQGRQGFSVGISTRVFEVEAGVTAKFEGLTITGGQAGYNTGGGILNSGTLTLIDCAVTNNLVYTTGLSLGGGIFNSGTLTLIRTQVSGNAALAVPNRGTGGTMLAEGGGIFSVGTLRLLDSQMTGNKVVADSIARPATALGGGVYSFGTLTARHSTFDANQADARSTILAVADAEGGGGYFTTGSATLNDCTVNGNQVTVTADVMTTAGGGGFYLDSGTLTMRDGTIADNRVTVTAIPNLADQGGMGTGGGVWINGGTARLVDVGITGNGIGVGNGGLAAIAQGGGVAVTAGTASLRDCTITGNAAVAANSGPWPASPVESASGGGLFVAATGATVRLRCTIVAHNGAFAAIVNGSDVAGPVISWCGCGDD